VQPAPAPDRDDPSAHPEEGDLDVVRRAYAAFARRDFAALLTLLDPDIEWESPEGTSVSGVFRGHEGVLAGLFVRLPDRREQFDIEPEKFLQDDDEVVVLGHHRGQGVDGLPYEIPFCHVWTLRQGFAVHFRSCVDAHRLGRSVQFS
jgi:ketosteroid isomerase-like protein